MTVDVPAAHGDDRELGLNVAEELGAGGRAAAVVTHLEDLRPQVERRRRQVGETGKIMVTKTRVWRKD